VAQIIAGVDWVTANAVRPAVANMSLGAFNSPSLEAAVTRSINRGIVYVVAAGNQGNDACARVPARVPEALTVGAVDATDTRAWFSNSGSCVDLLAPGVEIVSAGHRSDTARATLSGTSMATPHVAGVVARYLQQQPTASPAAVSAAVMDNTLVDRVGDPEGANRLLYSRFLDGVPPPSTPANDAYAAATPITGSAGTLVGGNRTATSEVGESLFDPGDAGATVWYRWTAPTTGPSPFFDVCDGGFDTVLSAYTGPTLAGRSSLTTGGAFCNVGTRKSGLSFPAVAGQDYYLAVDGTTADPAGWFQLRWTPPTP
jgi:subtilisin family serine protease